jgi:hypothetical protein
MVEVVAFKAPSPHLILQRSFLLTESVSEAEPPPSSPRRFHLTDFGL